MMGKFALQFEGKSLYNGYSVVKVSSEQFILYLLLFFAGFLSIVPKRPILHVAIPERTPNNSTPLPRIFLLNPQTLAANKARIQAKDPSIMPAYNNLITQANKLLTQKPVSVMEKSQTPPSGTKHDYMSLATYAWPNPNTKNGLPYITKDGQTNPEINSIPDSKNLHTMISSLNTLSLAYYFSDDKRYADHAALFIKTWFIDPKTKMNPNLNYSQIIKGKNSNKGMPGGVIDTANIPQVIDAIGILNKADIFSTSDKNTIQSWFGTYLKWVQTSDSGKYIGASKNNQHTFYDGQIISIALYLNQIELAKKIATTDMNQLIPEQIDKEGRQIQELSRTKSWDYSVLNIQGLCELADLSQNVHIDLWHYQTKDGRSIKKALDFLRGHTGDQKNWAYQQITSMNIKGLIVPLREASVTINSTYWNESVKMEGENSSKSLDILKYKVEN